MPNFAHHPVKLTVAIACALALALTGLPTERATAATAAQPSDFDGDGYADLAIGAPASLDNDRRGEVNVLYGSRSGLTAAGDQVWSQASPGVKGTSEPYEQFGSALASGDFDADGHADLAIGVPSDTVDGARAVGAVNVLYGSAAGLTAADDQLWSRVGLAPVWFGGAFGSALAAGDFDADGFWDLAISAPDDGDPSPSSPKGVVVILHGSGAGLTANGVQVLRDDQIASPDPLPMDVLRLGWSLVAGDFDDDGIADLAAGAPDSGSIDLLTGSIETPGAVGIFYGSTDGLGATRSELWHQEVSGIPDDNDAHDQFGTSLAAGDLDGDGDDDLVVGAIGEAADADEAGAVTVIPGSAGGLTATGSQQWHQDVAGVPGIGESNEQFGAALAVGDFDGDAREDLAIGVPAEDIGHDVAAGRVIVMRGSATGLTVMGVRVWTQDSPGIPGSVRDLHYFGRALTALDFGRSGRVDLAIGVPGQGVGGHRSAGMVAVLYGSRAGLVDTEAQAWSQASPGVKGAPANYEQFGAGLGR